jgi:hypothetical protein
MNNKILVIIKWYFPGIFIWGLLVIPFRLSNNIAATDLIFTFYRVCQNKSERRYLTFTRIVFSGERKKPGHPRGTWNREPEGQAELCFFFGGGEERGKGGSRNVKRGKQSCGMLDSCPPNMHVLCCTCPHLLLTCQPQDT